MYICINIMMVKKSFCSYIEFSLSPVAALSNISDQYAVAFGGFADKRAIPFSLPNQDPRAYQKESSPGSG